MMPSYNLQVRNPVWTPPPFFVDFILNESKLLRDSGEFTPFPRPPPPTTPPPPFVDGKHLP